MKKVPLPILSLHDALSNDLDHIKTRFKGPVKVTLIVRPLLYTNANLVLTDEDDPEAAVAALRELASNPGHEIPKGGTEEPLQ